MDHTSVFIQVAHINTDGCPVRIKGLDNGVGHRVIRIVVIGDEYFIVGDVIVHIRTLVTQVFAVSCHHIVLRKWQENIIVRLPLPVFCFYRFQQLFSGLLSISSTREPPLAMALNGMRGSFTALPFSIADLIYTFFSELLRASIVKVLP